jgi:hypothetical protein
VSSNTVTFTLSLSFVIDAFEKFRNCIGFLEFNYSLVQLVSDPPICLGKPPPAHTHTPQALIESDSDDSLVEDESIEDKTGANSSSFGFSIYLSPTFAPPPPPVLLFYKGDFQCYIKRKVMLLSIFGSINKLLFFDGIKFKSQMRRLNLDVMRLN